jgi:hypothetical protein
MAHDRQRKNALAQTRQSMIGSGNIMSQTLNLARTPDGAYRAAIVGALGICGLLVSLALVLF